MLKIDHLSTLWNDVAYGYDMHIPKGQLVGIIGPSGSGKSTLLHLIAGLLPVYQGSIFFEGKNITTLPAYQRPVSLLFQEHNVFEHLTVWQNIAIGLHPNLKLSLHEKKQIETLASTLGLSSMMQRHPNELSGGQKQRVAIARILLRRHPILLLDEPFSSLDPELREELLSLTHQIHKDHHLTTLIVSHHANELEDIADYFITIHPPSEPHL